MATAVFFHAHPDDESIATGGTMAKAAAAGHPVVPGEAGAGDMDLDEMGLGVPARLVTTRVDVRGQLEQKRRAMAAHASQISETSFFLSMDAERFALVWGIECYIRRGAADGTVEDDLFSA